MTQSSMECDSVTSIYHFDNVLPISDEVISIRLMNYDDAKAYADGTDDEMIRRFAHLPLAHYTPQIVCDMIDNAIKEGLSTGKLAVLTIADNKCDTFLGSFVFFDITPDEAEIGYWITRDQRGKKLSSRALKLAFNIAKQLGIKRLRACTVSDNIASEQALISTGFQHIGDKQDHITASGKNTKVANYLIQLSS